MMISDGLQDFDIILASSSPRRRQLMAEAGFSFRSSEVSYDEKLPPLLAGKDIAAYLAKGKSDAWNNTILPGQIIITADTVVWCHDKILGKPRDDKEAVHFLKILSGCRHEVITAICLRDNNRRHVFSVTTGVYFRPLLDSEIEYYVENYKPFDKAGAYGIQEWIGLRGITKIEGSYYNVVGMPVSELYTELLDFTQNK